MTDTRDFTSDSSQRGEVEHGEYDAAMYGPVSDWATDIDHADPQYNPNAPDVWKELRDGGCPVGSRQHRCDFSSQPV